jgi:hypothetical protein
MTEILDRLDPPDTIPLPPHEAAGEVTIEELKAWENGGIATESPHRLATLLYARGDVAVTALRLTKVEAVA